MANEAGHTPQRRSLRQWQTIVQRFRAGDLEVTEFCAREGVSRTRLSHWCRRLGGGAGDTEQTQHRSDGFVDAGVLGAASTQHPADAPVTVRIELGGGVSLTVSRT